MERLTERDEYGNADIIGVHGVVLTGYLSAEERFLNAEELNLVTDALNRLAAYEDSGLTPAGVSKLVRSPKEAEHGTVD